MRIDDRIWLGAQQFFTLAVDAKFNKGRRSEYLVASCLYLKCRYEQSPKMLIDFSERLGVSCRFPSLSQCLTFPHNCGVIGLELTPRSTCSSSARRTSASVQL